MRLLNMFLVRVLLCLIPYSLQSGSDDVLKLMRRRYDTALFASKIRKIKEMMPDAFIGVDVIVGTRGETELYFEDAYRFIEGLR